MTRTLFVNLVAVLAAFPVVAAEPPFVAAIPRPAKPVKIDGKLDDWKGAFATPVHVGHPDFSNRGGEFYYFWDAQNLYIGLRCLDKKGAHVGTDAQLWNGDAVEFYIDTRRGADLGRKDFSDGVFHLFYTPFTGTDVKPRFALRDLPHQKDLKLEGAEVAAEKTADGSTCEFKLPWALFPLFKPASGEIIGLECELCSSDGGPRSDRTFTFASPACVFSPSAFARVKLVDTLEPADLLASGRVLLPLSLAKSANYGWMYGTVGVSTAIADRVTKIEGRLVGPAGKVVATSTGALKLTGGFAQWLGAWELWDVPPGKYTLEITASGKEGVITSRSVKVLHEE